MQAVKKKLVTSIKQIVSKKNMKKHGNNTHRRTGDTATSTDAIIFGHANKIIWSKAMQSRIMADIDLINPTFNKLLLHSGKLT